MRTIYSLMIIALLLAVAGCSEQTSSPEPIAVVPPTEGETPSAVATLLQTNTPEVLETAPAAGENWTAWPPFDDVKNSDVYAVTILWGQLQNSTIPGMPVTDWSGRLWVNGVSVVQARRTISFESGEDYLVAEEIPSEAAWVSETSVDFDGISFLVFLRRDIVYIMAPTLHFETAPFSTEFQFSELVKLDKFFLLSSGNAVAVHARQIWPNRCPGGFMEGKWIKDDNAGMTGRIEGLWLNYRGEPMGVIAGTFSTTEDGVREYHGWVSGYMLPYVIAEFRGKWWYDDPRMCPLCGTGHGWFRGGYAYADGTTRRGVMMGEFGDFLSPSVNQLELPFIGVWSDICSWEPEGRQ